MPAMRFALPPCGKRPALRTAFWIEASVPEARARLADEGRRLIPPSSQLRVCERAIARGLSGVLLNLDESRLSSSSEGPEGALLSHGEEDSTSACLV